MLPAARRFFSRRRLPLEKTSCDGRLRSEAVADGIRDRLLTPKSAASAGRVSNNGGASSSLQGPRRARIDLQILGRMLGRPTYAPAPTTQMSSGGTVTRDGVYVHTVRGERRQGRASTFPYHDGSKAGYSASLPCTLRGDGTSRGDEVNCATCFMRSLAIDCHRALLGALAKIYVDVVSAVVSVVSSLGQASPGCSGRAFFRFPTTLGQSCRNNLEGVLGRLGQRGSSGSRRQRRREQLSSGRRRDVLESGQAHLQASRHSKTRRAADLAASWHRIET